MFSYSFLSRILVMGKKLYEALSREVWGYAPQKGVLGPTILMQSRGKITPRTVFFVWLQCSIVNLVLLSLQSVPSKD